MCPCMENGLSFTEKIPPKDGKKKKFSLTSARDFGTVSTFYWFKHEAGAVILFVSVFLFFLICVNIYILTFYTINFSSLNRQTKQQLNHLLQSQYFSQFSSSFWQKANYFGSLLQSSTVSLGSGLEGEVNVPFRDLLPMVHPNDIVFDGMACWR